MPPGVAKPFDVDPDPAETVATYFRGDRKAYDAIDPLKILETARFGGGAHGRIIAGLDDAEDREAGRELTAAAHAAGIDVAYSETPAPTPGGPGPPASRSPCRGCPPDWG